jgi:hypothetical protein
MQSPRTPMLTVTVTPAAVSFAVAFAAALSVRHRMRERPARWAEVFTTPAPTMTPSFPAGQAFAAALSRPRWMRGRRAQSSWASWCGRTAAPTNEGPHRQDVVDAESVKVCVYVCAQEGRSFLFFPVVVNALAVVGEGWG